MLQPLKSQTKPEREISFGSGRLPSLPLDQDLSRLCLGNKEFKENRLSTRSTYSGVSAAKLLY